MTLEEARKHELWANFRGWDGQNVHPERWDYYWRHNERLFDAFVAGYELRGQSLDEANRQIKDLPDRRNKQRMAGISLSSIETP